MPFVGRNLLHASTAFKDHLNQLLAHTITHTPVVAYLPRRDLIARIGFRQSGEPGTARLRTRFGPMDLAVSFLCDAHDVDGGVLSRIVSHRFALTPLGSSEPIFRWEYERFPSPGSYWCQHHIQGPIDVQLGRNANISLNDLHLPTGPLPIEEVIRFLIDDPGVPPLDDSVDEVGIPNWHKHLIESTHISSAT